MAGTTATRLWKINEKANRPWPVLDDDPVIDYMIMEAVALKADKEETAQEKKQQREDFKRDKEGLDKLRDLTS